MPCILGIREYSRSHLSLANDYSANNWLREEDIPWQQVSCAVCVPVSLVTDLLVLCIPSCFLDTNLRVDINTDRQETADKTSDLVLVSRHSAL